VPSSRKQRVNLFQEKLLNFSFRDPNTCYLVKDGRGTLFLTFDSSNLSPYFSLGILPSFRDVILFYPNELLALRLSVQLSNREGFKMFLRYLLKISLLYLVMDLLYRYWVRCCLYLCSLTGTVRLGPQPRAYFGTSEEVYDLDHQVAHLDAELSAMLLEISDAPSGSEPETDLLQSPNLTLMLAFKASSILIENFIYHWDSSLASPWKYHFLLQQTMTVLFCLSLIHLGVWFSSELFVSKIQSWMTSLGFQLEVWACHRRYIHRLRLPACTAGKICTAVILGLATAESPQVSWA